VAPAIPSREPETIVAGDTVKWTKSLTDFPAGTWTLTYELLHAGGDLGTVTASASGTDHSITIAAATTAAYNTTAADRLVHWNAFATAAGERYHVGAGSINVKPNPAVVSTLDSRSHAKIVLDAIEAVIENRATKDQMAYAIAGRSLSLTPLPDLLALRREYGAIVAAEERARRAALGLGHKGRCKTRFTR
jgi:hypothetical protein